jgi:hypothetical protein
MPLRAAASRHLKARRLRLRAFCFTAVANAFGYWRRGAASPDSVLTMQSSTATE